MSILLDMSTGLGIGAALLATSAASFTVVISTSQAAAADSVAFAERGVSPALTVLLLGAVMLVPVAVWVIAARPASALGLALAGVATAVPMWGAWPGLPDQVRAGALALSPAAVAAIGLCGVRWSADVRVGARRALAASGAFALAAVLIHMGGYDPFADVGCSRACVDVTPVLESVVSTPTTVAIVVGLTLLASGSATLGLVLATSTPGVVRLAAVAGTIWLSSVAVARWATWGDAETAGLLVVLAPLAPAVVAASACRQAVRTLRTRWAMSRLVDSLTLAGAASGIQYAIPGSDRWVDGSGLDSAPPPRSVVLSDGSGPAIRVAIPPRSNKTEIVAALTPASLLAMRNEQLSAAASARAAEVRESQRRVVMASDAERHRIQRDLHDGAQQRLVGVLFQLRLIAKALDASQRTRLEGIETVLIGVLSRLRALAHGTHGENVLEEEGLRAALEDLVASSDWLTKLDFDGEATVDVETARAAYAVVATTLAANRPHPDASIDVAVTYRNGTLRVAVSSTALDVRPERFVDTRDRLGALGGLLDLRSDSKGVYVEAVIPCGP